MEPDLKKEAAKRLLAIQDAERHFMGYVQLMHPDWRITWFQVELIDCLNKMFNDALVINDRPIRRLLINMPPRYSKSTIATHLFPSWYLGKKPARHTMSAAYSQDLANSFGAIVKSYVTRQEHRFVFPEFEMSRETSAKHDWRTTANGSYLGTGIGGQTTGRPANLLIIDDPIKSRQEAESATYRNRTWDFYLSSLENRKEPSSEGDNAPPLEIVIATRWHPDDLCGRIMQTNYYREGHWHHLCYPALREEKDKEGNVEKKALWPERGVGFQVEDLEMRRKLNEREFESLFQQRPYVRGGNLIKVEWWRYYDPDEVQMEDYRLFIIAADTAYRKGETNDYNAIGLWGLMNNGDIHLINMRRFRGSVAETKQALVQMNAAWRGRNLRGIYVEDRSSGHAVIDELKRESGLSVVPSRMPGDKVAKANAVLPLIEGGRVFLPTKAAWLDAFVQECTEFPDSSTHDDQVDQMSIALDALSRVGGHDTEIIDGPLKVGTSLRQSMEKNTATESLRKQFGHLRRTLGG